MTMAEQKQENARKRKTLTVKKGGSVVKEEVKKDAGKS